MQDQEKIWEEKRRHKRAYIKFPTECRSKNFWQYVEARDISAGGMFISTDKIEPVKTKIEIMFEFGPEENKKFIHAEGVVTWVRESPQKDPQGNIQPAGMGVMFTKLLPASAKEFIEKTIKEMEAKKIG